MLQTDTVAAIQTTVIREWADLFNWPALTATGLRVAGALVVAVIANYALKAVLRSVERSSEKDGIVTAQEQRTRTLLSLLRSMGRVVIWVMTLFMVLGALGLQLGPLLAGAGVVGLAVSFGAQSLVKDVISGLFILMENQFGVGDVVRLEGVSGAVERMTLRVVVLRDVHGVVHIVPNGEIKKVSNLTRGWARVVLDVAVAYKEDPDTVMAVMLDEGRRLYEDPQWRPLLLDEVQVPGIESFGEHGVTIRILAKTLPLKQWDVARELRRRLKLRFDHEKIDVPFPSQTMYWGEGQSPAELATLAAAPAPPTAGAADAER
ncbi:MAG TPA: mechanosensitive ion channel domain-containing protein [Longimicrobium sp.]|nr:mechanosensitive ion channel domain-containing protein [Longimicrobium sp.]